VGTSRVVWRLLVNKKCAGPWRLALNLRRVEATREKEAFWSLKACAELASCRCCSRRIGTAREKEVRWSLKACAESASCQCCSQRKSPLVLEVLRCISARKHGVDYWRKARATSAPLRFSCSNVSLVLRTSTRTHGVDHRRTARATSAPLRLSCITVSLVLRTSSAQLIGSVRGRHMQERTFTPSVMKKCNGMRTRVHCMMGWGPVASTLKDMPVRTQHAQF